MIFEEELELSEAAHTPSNDDITWYLNETYCDPYEALDEHL